MPGQTQYEMIEVDEEVADVFDIDEAVHGDESMSVKPWKGAIRAPSELPPIIPEAPKIEPTVKFVFGYRTEEMRMNLFYNPKKQPVYNTAALGIILNPKPRG